MNVSSQVFTVRFHTRRRCAKPSGGKFQQLLCIEEEAKEFLLLQAGACGFINCAFAHLTHKLWPFRVPNVVRLCFNLPSCSLGGWRLFVERNFLEMPERDGLQKKKARKVRLHVVGGKLGLWRPASVGALRAAFLARG